MRLTRKQLRKLINEHVYDVSTWDTGAAGGPQYLQTKRHGTSREEAGEYRPEREDYHAAQMEDLAMANQMMADSSSSFPTVDGEELSFAQHLERADGDTSYPYRNLLGGMNDSASYQYGNKLLRKINHENEMRWKSQQER